MQAEALLGVPPCPLCDEVGNHRCQPRADRAQNFVERLCVHTKGRSARQPFILADWQRDEIIRPLFGEVQWDDQLNEYVRRYSLSWMELARKNGKSELLSAIALYMLMADGEESAEVYSVAVDRDQASLVFNVAKRMVELSPFLSKHLQVIDSRKRILYVKTNSFYAVLPGDAGGALGTNPSAVLFDEVLTQKDRHLWDAMRQGFGARSQPLMVAATTAAYSSAVFALEEHEFSEKVAAARADGTEMSPNRHVFMRNTPKDWDWRDPGCPGSGPACPHDEEHSPTGWFWSNPALGDFLNINTLRSEAADAEANPMAQNAFRVFRLNQWVSSASRWLDMGLWDENKRYLLEREDLQGEAAYGGLDLSSVSDFTSWCLAFPRTTETGTTQYDVLWRFWLPETALNKRSGMREKLKVWADLGHITITKGDVIRWDQVWSDIASDLETFRVQRVGFDPWQAPQITQWMEDGGIVCVKIPQTTTRLNAPSREIERALGARSLNHGGNPVARWMADNTESFTDPSGNIKPDKNKSGDKIDGVMALANAVAVSLLPPDEAEEGDAGFINLEDYLA